MTFCLVCVVSSPQYPAIWGVGSFWRSGNFPNQGSSQCFVSPKTFSIKIMPSSLEQFLRIICNSLLPDFSPKIQWFLRRPQFETSSLLFNFEILTISLWLGRCCNFYISQKVSFLKLELLCKNWNPKSEKSISWRFGSLCILM